MASPFPHISVELDNTQELLSCFRVVGGYMLTKDGIKPVQLVPSSVLA